MWDKFDQALARYRELEQQLSDPAVVADRARYTRAAKEHGSLARRVKPYLEYQQISDELKQAEALAEAETDADMRRYAEEERDQLRGKEQALKSRLEDLLLEGP